MPKSSSVSAVNASSSVRSSPRYTTGTVWPIRRDTWRRIQLDGAALVPVRGRQQLHRAVANQHAKRADFEIRLGNRFERPQRGLGQVVWHQTHVTRERIGLVLEQHARAPGQMHRRLSADFVDDGPRSVECKVPERGTAAFDLETVQSGGVCGCGPDPLCDVRQPAAAHDAERDPIERRHFPERFACSLGQHGQRRRRCQLREGAVVVGEQQQMTIADSTRHGIGHSRGRVELMRGADHAIPQGSPVLSAARADRGCPTPMRARHVRPPAGATPACVAGVPTTASPAIAPRRRQSRARRMD